MNGSSPLQLASPDALDSSVPPDLSSARWRFLCEGDSWFTIGALNPGKNANLLQHLRFSQSCCAVSAAYPGDTLSHMVDRTADPKFTSLLINEPMRRVRAWDALLVSCGGNDLIDALGVAPVGEAATDASLRLLRTQAEWGPADDGPRRYVSESGWKRFADYLSENLRELVRLRDHPKSESKGVPMFLHSYAIPTPRPAGAGLGAGPWLRPSLVRYGIPPQDWPALAEHLVRRLAATLQTAAASLPNVHVFNSIDGLDILAAAADGDGASGDWSNEIHLLPSGCAKLAAAWGAEIEAEMLRQGR